MARKTSRRRKRNDGSMRTRSHEQGPFVAVLKISGIGGPRKIAETQTRRSAGVDSKVFLRDLYPDAILSMRYMSAAKEPAGVVAMERDTDETLATVSIVPARDKRAERLDGGTDSKAITAEDVIKMQNPKRRRKRNSGAPHYRRAASVRGNAQPSGRAMSILLQRGLWKKNPGPKAHRQRFLALSKGLQRIIKLDPIPLNVHDAAKLLGAARNEAGYIKLSTAEARAFKSLDTAAERFIAREKRRNPRGGYEHVKAEFRKAKKAISAGQMAKADKLIRESGGTRNDVMKLLSASDREALRGYMQAKQQATIRIRRAMADAFEDATPRTRTLTQRDVRVHTRGQPSVFRMSVFGSDKGKLLAWGRAYKTQRHTKRVHEIEQQRDGTLIAIKTYSPAVSSWPKWVQAAVRAAGLTKAARGEESGDKKRGYAQKKRNPAPKKRSKSTSAGADWKRAAMSKVRPKKGDRIKASWGYGSDVFYGTVSRGWYQSKGEWYFDIKVTKGVKGIKKGQTVAMMRQPGEHVWIKSA